MSSKNTILEKESPSLTPRRINARRRSKSRACASPGRGPLNNGLMTAAWPKTPTYRSTKVKAVNNAKSQGWTGGPKLAHMSDQVEEMEIDSHDTSVMLSVGAFTEFNVMKTHANTSQKKIIPSSEIDKSPKPNMHGLKNSKETNRRLNLSTALKSDSSDKDAKCSPERPIESKSNTNGRQKSNMSPIFIILHVGKIETGLASGSASGPVKIYGERVMVQMEDEITKENISFRIICKSIRELEASLEQQPFFLKLKVSAIQYTNRQKSVIKKGVHADANEKITLHLAYETEVPLEVKTGLRELFKERLGDTNNWKEVSPVSAKDEIPSTERSPQSPAEKRKYMENESDDKEEDNRKRTTGQQTDQKAEVPSFPEVKVARRALFQKEEGYQERIKSLESEAARYQLMLGHKRLEIQDLEQQLRKSEEDTLLAIQELQRELSLRDNEVVLLQGQVDALQLEIKSEKDTISAQREQICELQRTIVEKTLAVEEHQQAIVVRDNQLKEVRALATSPSRMSESELRVQIKRLETVLRQTRTSLEETRRSKNSISSELRRNVDRTTDLREQLRSEISRNRRLETEASTAAQQNRDLIISKRTMQMELNDERERTTLFERERLDNQRRIEDEVSLRVRTEAELSAIRAALEEKEHLIDSLCVERDSAITEVSILKREISYLNEEATEEKADSSAAQQGDNESHDWIIDRDEVIVLNNILGEGGWGQVKLGKFRGTDVAVKQIHQLILSPHNRRLFNREMDIASRCRHPCLLQFIGATGDDGMPLFVTELMEADLRSCLSQQPLNDADVLSIALDVALALNYLHKQKPLPIIHRDISSANVLIWYKGNEMHGKLSDYGAANFMRLSMTRHPGASLYSAPETASGEQTTKIDIYSFGVLFCEMSIRELPVSQHREQQISLMKMPTHRQLVLRCIVRNPVSRPNADEIVELLKSWKSR